MWLIEEMCNLSCELIIYVNCKQDFAYGACMITAEAVHANKRLCKELHSLGSKSIQDQVITLMTWKMKGLLLHNIYLIWGCGLVFRVSFWSEERHLQKIAFLFHEIFFPALYSESYLIRQPNHTLETQILSWKAVIT